MIQQLNVWPLLQELTQRLVLLRADNADNADNAGGSSDDDDLLVTAGRCIDALAFVVLQDLIKCCSQSASSTELIEAHVDVINTVIPTCLQLLGHCDDDVAEATLPSLQEYLSVAKQAGAVLGDDYSEALQQLLTTTVIKLKYEPDDEPDNGSEDDALFQEFRRELKGLFGNLCHWVGRLVCLNCATAHVVLVIEYQSRSGVY